MTPTEMHIDALMEKIEKLEAENARVWELHNDFLNNKMISLQKEIHDLRAENARYREALEKIESFTMSQFMGIHDMALECKIVARQALKGVE